MGIAKSDIAHVKLSMRGAISDDLGVEGGIFVEVATNDRIGAPRKTKQLMYVTGKIDKAFLCREALVALGTIPQDFPSVPTSWPTEVVTSMDDSGQPHC